MHFIFTNEIMDNIVFEHHVAFIRISLTNSPPSLMQIRIVHNFSLIQNNIKISPTAACFSLT
jgi:hypothetical protein